VWLFIIFHLFAAMSLSIASALACRALVVLPFWAGALMGLCLYVVALALTALSDRSQGE
jgi:type IV secretory pathway TrbD component